MSEQNLVLLVLVIVEVLQEHKRKTKLKALNHTSVRIEKIIL